LLSQTHEMKVADDATSKEEVRNLLKSIETGDPKPFDSINPRQYTQHNLAAADGLSGFGALMAQLPKGSARVNTAGFPG